MGSPVADGTCASCKSCNANAVQDETHLLAAAKACCKKPEKSCLELGGGVEGICPDDKIPVHFDNENCKTKQSGQTVWNTATKDKCRGDTACKCEKAQGGSTALKADAKSAICHKYHAKNSAEVSQDTWNDNAAMSEPVAKGTCASCSSCQADQVQNEETLLKAAKACCKSSD